MKPLTSHEPRSAGRLIRIARMTGFLLDIALALVLSILFAMMISGQSLNIDHRSVSNDEARIDKLESRINAIERRAESIDKAKAVPTDNAKQTEKVSRVEELLGLSLNVTAEKFTWPERFLMFVIGLTLTRLLHSFFLLSRDDKYELAMYEIDRRQHIMVGLQTLAQVLIVGLCFIAVSKLKPGSMWLPAWGLCMWFALLIWDVPALILLKKSLKSRYSDHIKGLERTFSLWVKLDLTAFSVIFLPIGIWGFISIFGNKDWVFVVAISQYKVELIQWLTVTVLLLFTAIDYWHNLPFYSRLPLAGSTREMAVD